MSKTVTSPSKHWPGSVVLSDPLTLPQVEAIEAGMDVRVEGERVFYTVLDKPVLPAVLACVEKWELGNFPTSPTVDTFPMSPRKASHDLIAWIFGEIRNIYSGEQEVPNE